MWKRFAIPTQWQANNGAAAQVATGNMTVYEALSMDGRRGRAWRFIGLAWLFVLIGPTNELFHTQQSPLRIGFGLVGAASFIVLYLWALIGDHERLIARFPYGGSSSASSRLKQWGLISSLVCPGSASSTSSVLVRAGPRRA